jgi:hypothetical protein
MFRRYTSAGTCHPAGRRGRLGRLAVTAVSAFTAVGFLGVLGAGPANAAVARNGFAAYYPNIDHTGCELSIGNQASPANYGIGEVDVTGCPIPENLVIYVYLDHANSYGGALTTVAENYWAGTAKSVGVRTVPSVCNYISGHDYWTVFADVSFNGGYTWTGWVTSQQWVHWESGRC